MIKQRDSKFELLRIFSMLMIIGHHLAYHGFGIYTSSSNNFNYNFVNLLNIGGKLGVNIFVIISGYFMCKSNFNFKKLFKICGQIIFYSFIFYILYILLVDNNFSYGKKDFLMKIIFPGDYWFATTYIWLMILSPFINTLIKNTDKKNYLKLIIILLLLFCIMPNFYPVSSGYTDLAWFITLYLIGGYINLFVKELDKKYIIFVTLILFILSMFINQKYGYNNNHYATQNGILTLPLSISIFLLFHSIKSFNSKFINLISSSTFGIYLIHDNSLFKYYFWENIVHVNKFIGSNYLYLWVIFIIIFVFIICSIIDIIRIKTIEKLYMKSYDYISIKFKRKKITN